MTPPTTIEDRLRALEDRVAAAEATADILRLMGAYGPAIDSASTEAVVALWRADGIYDVERFTATGADALRRFARDVHDPAHGDRQMAHLLGIPQIVVTGDRAVALCHSLLFRATAGRFVVERIAANRWDFARGGEGWRVVRRTNRAIEDGGRALFADAIAGSADPQPTRG